MGTLEVVLGNIATQTFVAGGGATQPPGTTPAAPAATAPAPAATSAGEAEPTAIPPTQAPQQLTATPIIVSTATPGIPKTYQLQKGEFPFCIARRFNVDQYELLNINGLSLNSQPQVGFTLKIPQTGNPFSGDRSLQDHPTTYTVAAGDTIYTVACKYGDVDPLAIAQANDLSAPYTLEAGDKINIP
jgi:LysM repeat protein